MDYFTIGGVSSSSFNAYIYDLNVFDSPSRSVDTYDVPGRNGTLTVAGSEKLENRELWYDMYIPKSMISNVRGLFTASKAISALRILLNLMYIRRPCM